MKQPKAIKAINPYEARMQAVNVRAQITRMAIKRAEMAIREYMRDDMPHAAERGEFSFVIGTTDTGTNTEALKKKFPNVNRSILYETFLSTLLHVLKNYGFSPQCTNIALNKHDITVRF